MRKLLFVFLTNLLVSVNVYSQCVITSIKSTGPTTCGGSNGSLQLVGLTDAAAQYAVTYIKDGGSPITATITADGNSITLTGLGIGTYTSIRVTNTVTGCIAGDSGPFFLMDPRPIPLVITPASTTICSGSSVTLTASGGSNFTWSPAHILSATTGNVVVASPLSNNNTVEVTGKDVNNCLSTGSATVYVNTPEADLSENVEACLNAAAPNFTFTGKFGTAPYTFTYKINGGAEQTLVSTGNVASLPVPTTTAGSFVYTVVRVSDAIGCVTTAARSATVTITTPPATPTITASATTICAGGSTTLTSSASAGNQWFKDGALISGATSSTYAATTAGVYTVRVTRGSCPVATSAGTTLTVTPLPAQPVITAAGNVLTSSAASGNQWYLNGSLLPGATNATYNVQAAGQYTVSTTQNGCTSTSASYNFVATAILQPGAWNGEVTVFPNPVVRALYIKNAGGRKLNIQLVDAIGKVVYRAAFTAPTATIDMAAVATGTYRLLITDLRKEETISISIIKQ